MHYSTSMSTGSQNTTDFIGCKNCRVPVVRTVTVLAVARRPWRHMLCRVTVAHAQTYDRVELCMVYYGNFKLLKILLVFNKTKTKMYMLQHVIGRIKQWTEKVYSPMGILISNSSWPWPPYMSTRMLVALTKMAAKPYSEKYLLSSPRLLRKNVDQKTFSGFTPASDVTRCHTRVHERVSRKHSCDRAVEQAPSRKRESVVWHQFPVPLTQRFVNTVCL